MVLAVPTNDHAHKHRITNDIDDKEDLEFGITKPTSRAA